MSDLLDVLPDFNLKPYTHLIYSLEKNDFTVADLITLDPKEIARRCPLPSADVHKLVDDVIRALQRDVHTGVAKPGKVSAAGTQQSKEEDASEKKVNGVVTVRDDHKVKTLDARIDLALGGGFQPGHITEIVGESAVGKTQLVLGLLLSVQLPPPQGLGRHAIYVSTEDRLNTVRLKQMLETHPEYARMDSSQRPSLDRIHTIATNDLEAQEHILRYQLPVAVERLNVGLIILDSVAANFRAEHETRTPAGLAQRAIELTKLGGMLRRVALENNVAVVVTNQVSDRFDDSKNPFGGSSSPATTSSPSLMGPPLPPAVARLRSETQSLDHQQRFFTGWGDETARKYNQQLKTPALGLAWANQISARIVLKMERERQEYAGGNIWKDKKKRRALGVVFAPWAAPTSPPVRYEIEAHGIVSLDPAEQSGGGATKKVEEEHADLLDEALWASDEDDEYP